MEQSIHPTHHRLDRAAPVNRPRRERFQEALEAFGLARRPIRSSRTPTEGREIPPDFTELVASLDSEEIDELIEVICTRDLCDAPYPFVTIDVVPPAEDAAGPIVDLVTVTGVTWEGDFEPLGFSTGDTSDQAFWEGLMCSLVLRGLHGVRVVGSPELGDLRAALRRMLPEAQWREVGPIETVSLHQALEVIREAEVQGR